MSQSERIHLAPPNVGAKEQEAVKEALLSGWIAPVGPQLDAFEQKLERFFPEKRVLALNSGTAALHLSLILAEVRSGDLVLLSSFTFAACANVVLYQGAVPVFIDSEPNSWNLDPELLEEYLSNQSRMPKAIIVTHLYGVPADLDRILEVADRHGIIVVEDAAEALGSRIGDYYLGGMAEFGVLSFNGNKVVTTGGGGALICSPEHYEKGLHLATQANRGQLSYDHDQVGYNYRLSNVLANLGLSQLHRIDEFLMRKRNIFTRYKEALSGFLKFPEWDLDTYNHWLSVAHLSGPHGVEALITHLASLNIESRRLWKPLHLHQAYSQYPFVGTGICEAIFDKGFCLPSGSGLRLDQQEEVITVIKDFYTDF